MPKVKRLSAVNETRTILTQHQSMVTESRLALLALTGLNPNSPSFPHEKSDIVSRLQNLSETGLSTTMSPAELPKVDDALHERYSDLMRETHVGYEEQKKLLEKVFATSTYAEGITILRSPESVKLITKQSNLILEYQFWIDKMNTLVD
jgi:hypothetical protein